MEKTNVGTVSARRKRRGMLLALVCWMLAAASAAAQGNNGCATGASALGNAFVRANPIYAVYFGDPERYVSSPEVRAHFAPGADAVRCARVLSNILLAGAVQAYDPDLARRQDELNVRLGTMGISAGPSQPSASTQLYFAARTLAWMATVLPPAAGGDLAPMYTPQTDEDQLRIFLRQVLATLLQDPSVRESFQMAEAQVRALAELEYQWIVRLARQVAQ